MEAGVHADAGSVCDAHTNLSVNQEAPYGAECARQGTQGNAWPPAPTGVTGLAVARAAGPDGEAKCQGSARIFAFR